MTSTEFLKENLQLPHPRLHERNFVLFPLKEISPMWEHPVLNRKINYFINKLNITSHIEIARIQNSAISKLWNNLDLIDKTKSYNRFFNKDTLSKAYEFAVNAHKNQKGNQVSIC